MMDHLIDKLNCIQPQLKGKVLVTLSYDPQLSLLKGIVLKAADLKKQDIVGQAGSDALRRVCVATHAMNILVM